MTRPHRVPDLGAAPALLAAPCPEDCDNLSSAAFFEVLADACRRDHPDLANRFERFAAAFRSPAERERRRLGQRDDLIRELAGAYYPASLGCNGRAAAHRRQGTRVNRD